MQIKIQGQVKLECRDKNGNLKWETGWIKNGITNTGKAAAAALVGDVDSISPFSYIAVGTSNTAFGASQTALQAEITDTGLARKSATVIRVTDIVTNDTLQFTASWNVTGSKTIEEAGIFNDASAGIMLCRVLTDTKTVEDEDVFTLVYKVRFS